MADDLNKPDRPADEPLVEAEEPELVAYLDGELDAATARRVEDRLNTDPKARSRAELLKKTFDLLDYLPKPEPSATFASRTIERLPVVGGPPPTSAALLPTPPLPSSTMTPVRLTPASGSVVLPFPSGSGALPLPPRRRGWVWVVSALAALVLAVGAGYLGHAAARTYLFPPTDSGLSLEDDRRLIRNLPYYAGVDDYDFLVHLADSEAFSHDAEPYSDLSPPPPAIAEEAAEPPWKEKLEPLIRAFKGLPPARQAQVRDLDRQIHEQPPAERAKLFLVLESYAVWLARLPEADRRAILGAATPGLRADVIRDVREGQWKAHLPEEQRKQLNATDPERRADLIQKWKDEETERQRAWLLARKNWETIRNNQIPWPFDNEALKKEVAEFVRTVLKVDGASNGRLTAIDADRLRDAHARAESHGGWLWYGFVVREMAEKYPMFPPPLPGTKVAMEVADLPKGFDRQIVGKKSGSRQALRNLSGRWPEFALAVVEDARKANVSIPASLRLGPCKPDDYTEPVRRFFKTQLEPKLSVSERNTLQSLEGKWPDHPKKMLELSKKHDLAMPGVTLPGSPIQWEKTYRVPMGTGKSGA